MIYLTKQHANEVRMYRSNAYTHLIYLIKDRCFTEACVYQPQTARSKIKDSKHL